MHVLFIVLGIVAAIMFLCSCSESGGEFVHGMSESAWTEFRESDTEHSVIEKAGTGFATRRTEWKDTFDKVVEHDWGYGLTMLSPGTKAVFENAKTNIDTIIRMVSEGIGNLNFLDEI